MSESNANYLVLSASITSAFVTRNLVPPEQLPALIADVFVALKRAEQGPVQPEKEAAQPAVSIKKSITPDFLICLEDGRKFRTLKRHLRVAYGLSPDDYRAKWKLSSDYPMVAPNYAATRSLLAKKMKLGYARRAEVVAVPKRKSKSAKGRRKAA